MPGPVSTGPRHPQSLPSNFRALKPQQELPTEKLLNLALAGACFYSAGFCGFAAPCTGAVHTGIVIIITVDPSPVPCFCRKRGTLKLHRASKPCLGPHVTR